MAIITGTNNPETLTGTKDADQIRGLQGNDIALMDDGDDIFLWNPGDGSDVVEGGAGNDTVSFNGANITENISIFADAGRAELTRDIAAIQMDTNDVERLELRTLGGSDFVTINDLSSTELKAVAIDLSGTTSGNGDGASDVVSAIATNAANNIVITQTESFVTVTGLPVELTINGAESTDTLVITAGGGSDTIDGSAIALTGIDLQIDGGQGNDTIIGGGRGDSLFAGDGNDTVIGGQGDDVAFLGAGDDRFIWNAGHGNDIIEGEDGLDTLVFNSSTISERIDVTANGGRALLLRDVASVTMDLDNVERIEVHAAAGIDTITVGDLSGTDVKTVAVDLAATVTGTASDKQLDTVNVNGSALIDDAISVSATGSKVLVGGLAASVVVDHADKTDLLVLNGNQGNDTIDASKLGAGLISLQINGGLGTDTLLGSAGDDLVTGGDGDDLAKLGAGNDRFVWNPGDDNDTVFGGAGNDTLQFNGANIAENIDISANADHALFFRNIANVFMDLDAVERIEFRAQGGVDTITIHDLSPTDVKAVAIDLGDFSGTTGDGALDTISVDASGAANTIKLTQSTTENLITVTGLPETLTVRNAEATDVLVINGLGGNDTIDASGLTLGLDLRISGGIGNDTITGSAAANVLNGDEGNDTIVWNPGGGNDLVNGGADTDTFVMNGNTIGENFAVLANGAGAFLTRDVAVTTISLSQVEQIRLNTGGGADSVLVDNLAGTGVTKVAIDLAAPGAPAGSDADRVTVLGTLGDDVMKITNTGTKIVISGLAAETSIDHAGKDDTLILQGSNGNDTIDASKLGAGLIGLQINGGLGADTLLGSAGDDLVTGGDGDDIAQLGAGNDRFIWNPGDDNDTVLGGAGNDTLQFNGANIAENIDISANADHALFFRNIANVFMDLDDVERIEFRALGGADTITVNNMAATDVKQVALDLSNGVGGGDGAADTVIVNAGATSDSVTLTEVNGVVTVAGLAATVSVSGGELNQDRVVVNALGGNDTIDASKLPANLLLTIDGGEGNDTIHGGFGSDVLVGGNGNDTVSGGAGSDTIFLGAGDDLYRWAPGEGSDAVNGETGADTAQINGDASAEAYSVAASDGAALVNANGAALVLSDVERIEFRPLGGADFVTVHDLTGTAVSQVAIDLASANGGTTADSKADTVIIDSAFNGTLTVAATGTKMSVLSGAQTITVDHWDGSDLLILQGSGGSDTLDASAVGADKMKIQLQGGEGFDTLLGSAGDDIATGGAGDDLAKLGAGDDRFLWEIGDGSDTVDGGAGNDTATFTGGAGTEFFILEAGGDHALLNSNLGESSIDLLGVERLEFKTFGESDFLSIGDLSGTGVKEVAIDLGATPGVGDGFGDAVFLSGSAGNDSATVSLAGNTVSITGLAAQVTMAAIDNQDSLEIDGGAGNDTINAGGLAASGPHLTLNGEGGADTLTGGLGNDQIFGGTEGDKLMGAGGDDVIGGNDGKDVIAGGAGNDTLIGGTGDDTITGGSGADTIFYNSTLDGRDVITDFDGDASGGQDVLNLSGLFNELGVNAEDRADRVSIIDNGASVNIAVDTDGNIGNGFELTVATLKTSDAITVGQDVLVS